MAAVIDATPGSATANSFTTIADANLYFDGSLWRYGWPDDDSDGLQTRGLITATRLIVDAFSAAGWSGWPASQSQALPFPRSGAYYRNGAPIPNTVIPIELKNATADYAGRLIEGEQAPDVPSGLIVQGQDVTGIKKFKAGPIEFEFDPAAAGVGTYGLPDAVFAMISFLFELFARSRTCVPLFRV